MVVGVGVAAVVMDGAVVGEELYSPRLRLLLRFEVVLGEPLAAAAAANLNRSLMGYLLGRCEPARLLDPLDTCLNN